MEHHEPAMKRVRELCTENQLSSAFPRSQRCLGLVLCASEQRQDGAWEEECPHVCTWGCAAKKALLCCSLSVSSPQGSCSLCNFVQRSWKRLDCAGGGVSACTAPLVVLDLSLAKSCQESAWRCWALERDGRKGFSGFTALRALKN